MFYFWTVLLLFTIFFISGGEPVTQQDTNKNTFFELLNSDATSGPSSFPLSENMHCLHCPDVFFSQHEYKRHMCELHGHLMPYCCKLCGKGCLSRQSLAFHMQGHKGRNFCCSVCGKRFTLKHHLSRHVAMIHCLHQCTKCFAVFKHSHEFNLHLGACKSWVGRTEPAAC